MMIRFNSSVGQVVKAWINPRTITTVEIPVTPIDTESLFGLFDRYNATTFYAGGGGGGKVGSAKGTGQSYRCCATGTCDNIT